MQHKRERRRKIKMRNASHISVPGTCDAYMDDENVVCCCCCGCHCTHTWSRRRYRPVGITNLPNAHERSCKWVSLCFVCNSLREVCDFINHSSQPTAATAVWLWQSVRAKKSKVHRFKSRDERNNERTRRRRRRRSRSKRNSRCNAFVILMTIVKSAKRIIMSICHQIILLLHFHITLMTINLHENRKNSLQSFLHTTGRTVCRIKIPL